MIYNPPMGQGVDIMQAALDDHAERHGLLSTVLPPEPPVSLADIDGPEDDYCVDCGRYLKHHDTQHPYRSAAEQS